jgi:hypothetical protein
VAYVGGPGEGVDRLVRTVQDDARLAESIWNRREIFVNATNAEDADELDSIGSNTLYAYRPKIRFTGILTEAWGYRFGSDWERGDRVTLDYKKRQFDAVIKTLPIQVTNRRERITPRIEVTL